MTELRKTILIYLPWQFKRYPWRDFSISWLFKKLCLRCSLHCFLCFGMWWNFCSLWCFTFSFRHKCFRLFIKTRMWELMDNHFKRLLQLLISLLELTVMMERRMNTCTLVLSSAICSSSTSCCSTLWLLSCQQLLKLCQLTVVSSIRDNFTTIVKDLC